MYGNLDRFAVKQLGSIVGDSAKWPGAIKVWCGQAATAVAPVAAMPTTASHLNLWNGAAQGSGICLVILSVGTIITTSAGAAIELGLAACVNTALVTTAPTGTAASTITPLTGATPYGGPAKLLSAVTIVNDGLWLPVVNSVTNANTANVMSSVTSDVTGRFVIQPGQQFNLASLANSAGSAVCKPWIIWAEVQFAA